VFIHSLQTSAQYVPRKLLLVFVNPENDLVNVASFLFLVVVYVTDWLGWSRWSLN